MSASKKHPKMLQARVTFLKMEKRAIIPIAAPSLGGKSLALMRAENCPIHFYRYLYEQIGKPHHWRARRKQTDAEAAEIIHAPTTFLKILYCGGCPAGFSETLFHQENNGLTAEIMYFGLMREYQGLGLSRFFLSETLRAAWAENADKIIIQTNSLDSPRALQLYQKAGFVPTGTRDTEIEAWE